MVREARLEAARLTSEGVRRGTPVVLSVPDGPEYALRLLSVLAVPARPVLLPFDAPREELRRAAELAGAVLSVRNGGQLLRLRRDSDAAPVNDAVGEEAVGLLTSGSSGRPKLVWRSGASLVDEGRRYRDLLSLGPDDRIVLPLPLSHAYALGWLAAGFVSGATVQLIAPRALRAVTEALSAGATVVALVPGLARLLARRQAGDRMSTTALRVAMVGAGPVDRDLDERFEAAFGIRLSRNYGSTEMGGVLAGWAPLPPFCVGGPMPGVRIRVDDREPGPEAVAGELHVHVDGRWHATGDVVRWQDGLVAVVGRQSSALRRGDRWVSPFEVEEALLGHPDVTDVRVVRRPGPRPSEDRILAIVVPARPDVTAAGIHTAAQDLLAPYKRPDRVVLQATLRRNEVGKIPARATYRLAGAARFAAANREAAALAEALRRLGVLALLDGETDTAVLSCELGLPLPGLEAALDAAAAAGLVAQGRGTDQRAAPVAPATPDEGLVAAFEDAIRQGRAPIARGG